MLEHQIDNQTYEKYLLNQTSFDSALPQAVAAQAKLAVKDHYTFDLLELSNAHEERELETALIANIQRFLTEMGPHFTFVGSQYRLAHGFVYLVAVIDWYSRRVLSWRISNTLDTAFCVDCLEEALQRYGNPEIFNTDQGCQFTSENFTGVLKAHSIAISMDGRGRALDNIFVE